VQSICNNATCKINQRYFSDIYLNVSQEVSQEVSSGVCLVLKDKSNAYLCSRPLILVGSFFFLSVRSQRYSNGTWTLLERCGTEMVRKRYGTETSTKFFLFKGIA
jgi:hypothetical protein